MEERARKIIEARGFDGLSDMIATLIREEWERRHPSVLQETHQPIAHPPEKPAHYGKPSSASGKDTEGKIVDALKEDLAQAPPPGRKRKHPK